MAGVVSRWKERVQQALNNWKTAQIVAEPVSVMGRGMYWQVGGFSPDMALAPSHQRRS
jgi:hypothetical protein